MVLKQVCLRIPVINITSKFIIKLKNDDEHTW